MERAAILATIVQSPRLPTPPSVALQVLRVSNLPTCSLKELGQVISCDASLSTRILKLVNSSLYRPAQPVGSLNRALQMLGLKRVRNLALGLALPALRFRASADGRRKAYWKGSVAQAIIAHELAVQVRRPDADTDMMAGLLCNLGTLLLEEACPREYQKVLALPPEEQAGRLCALEEEVLGVHHAEVAAAVLSRWGLPAELTEAVRHHHAPAAAPAPDQDRAWLLYTSGLIAELASGQARAEALAEIDNVARARYGLDDQALGRFLDALHPKIDEFASLIELECGPTENFQTLYTTAAENLTKLAVELSLDNFKTHEEKAQVEQDLKRAEETLQKQEEHLRHMQKMEAIGRLAGGVAHDFNNLLTVINGYSQMLLTMLPPGEPTYDLAREIHAAGDRAAGLTRQLLAFSRKQVLKPQVLDVNVVLTEMDSLLRRLAGENIKLAWSLTPGIRRIKADRGQFEQVIMNLAVNARDAIPSGGTIEIHTEEVNAELSCGDSTSVIVPGPYVHITISDTGVGMSAETLQHLFEPFFTTKEVGKGTGLGLAVVHGIVKQSGGHIRVSSKLGEGSSFRIMLPGVNEQAEPATRPGNHVSPTGTETVLIVEDEDSVRAVARHTLQRCGYQTLEARNGVDALQLGLDHTGPIDLLLTDVAMPQMGGFDLALRLKGQRPEIKVLYTSGYAELTQMDAEVPPVDACFLQKPFTSRDLALKVRAVLS